MMTGSVLVSFIMTGLEYLIWKVYYMIITPALHLLLERKWLLLAGVQKEFRSDDVNNDEWQ